MIKTIIVDDEQLARNRIRRMLKTDPSILVVGEFASGEEALIAIKAQPPDLLFLDVQMPGMDGFGLLSALEENELPVVVFVTAFDQYALKAFEAFALDYLLKPFDRKRFEKTVQRAKQVIEHQRLSRTSQNLAALLENLKPQTSYLERLAVRQGDGLRFIKIESVDWIEAEGNYVKLHAGQESHLLREPLSHLETRLDPKRFVRIHRSTLVNLDRVIEIHPLFHGNCCIVLQDGTQLTMTRNYRENFPHLPDRLT
ncbi:MAG TPA: LytTR family DNA-binding domain-containing protein [Acidobacteriota bacterium]|nr:LytTR family DNA-binding domain-containing protein [Acidobacteriota bacterium]